MIGVTIIDSIDIFQLAGWQLLVGFIPYIIFAAIGFILMYKTESKNTSVTPHASFPVKFVVYLLIGGFISLVSILLMGKFCPADYVETQYEIRIEDSASFNEVYEKYSIIEEKEDTFIVTEKE
jgi:lipid-A-disaccharide synthase-like uncharacterized protein